MPKITIIIPMYNSKKYIQECLDSIYRQTLKDVEIICVDDGSIDGTVDCIVKEKRNKDIIILKQEHKGPGLARNYGLSVALGEYVSFLDSDDFYYDIDALERMYEYGVLNSTNVVGSFYFRRFIEGTSKYRKIYVAQYLKNEKNNFRWINFKDYQENRHYCTYIFKRDYLIKNKFFFPYYFRYQDPPFLLRVLNLENEILFLNTCLLCNRVGKKRKILNGKQISDLLCGMKDVLELSIKYGYDQIFYNTIKYINVNYKENIVCYPTENNIKKLTEIENFISKNTSKMNLIPLEIIREKLKNTKLHSFQMKNLSTKLRPNAFWGMNWATLNEMCQAGQLPAPFGKDFIVTNDSVFLGEFYHGMPVCSVEALLHCDVKPLLLVHRKDYATAVKRLAEYGFVPGVDIVDICHRTDEG